MAGGTRMNEGAGRLVAVVVTYNRLDQLKQTLTRLFLASADHLHAVLVLDNASDDGTSEWLATQNEARLTVLSSDLNLGGAGGFETGMRAAVEQFDPDWLVVMDDDGRPMPGCLAAFHAASRGQSAGWAAAVRYPDGRICDMNRPWINPFRSWRDLLHVLRRGRDGFHLTERDYSASKQRAIDGGSFVGLFVSRAAIERVGYPDGRLFLYGDDVLYTLGLSQANEVITFDPNLTFEHDCATLVAGGGGVMTPLWKTYYYHRNLLIVYRRAAGPVLFWPVLLAKSALWARKARAYGTERRAYLHLLRWAVWDGVRHDTTRPRADILQAAKGDI